MLFAQKKAKNLSFETIASALGREEVAVAAIFYGQANASDEDIAKLAQILDIPEETLRQTEITALPDRGRSMEMPPKEPLMYRLYEIVQNYGYAYKAVMNEKFGDGIMSAISFSTKVSWIGLGIILGRVGCAAPCSGWKIQMEMASIQYTRRLEKHLF